MALPVGWEQQVLRGIRAPVTSQNLRFLDQWHLREGGGDKNNANFNPLNTTQGAPGAGSINSVGVKSYRSPGQGIAATVATLLNGHYGDIVGGLRSGRATAAQLANSRSLDTWGTGRWGSGAAPQGGAIGRSVRLASATLAPPSTSASALKQAAVSYLLQSSDQLASGGHSDPNALLDNLMVAKQLQQTPAPQVAQAAQAATGAPAPAPSSKGGTVNFDGKPVAAWIGGILQKARSAGWKGTVSSGYRSVAEQARIYNSGVRPAAKPGQSNHNFTAYPGGAVDVTDPQGLAATLRRLGVNQLVWAGGKDPVHFSHPHNGGY